MYKRLVRTLACVGFRMLLHNRQTRSAAILSLKLTNCRTWATFSRGSSHIDSALPGAMFCAALILLELRREQTAVGEQEPLGAALLSYSLQHLLCDRRSSAAEEQSLALVTYQMVAEQSGEHIEASAKEARQVVIPAGLHPIQYFVAPPHLPQQLQLKCSCRAPGPPYTASAFA